MHEIHDSHRLKKKSIKSFKVPIHPPYSNRAELNGFCIKIINKHDQRLALHRPSTTLKKTVEIFVI